jgi:hypothetical protein
MAMNNFYTPEKSRRHAVLSVRRFHRQLIESGLAPSPPASPTSPPPRLDMSGSFGRRRQAENVAPPRLLERLRDLV